MFAGLRSYFEFLLLCRQGPMSFGQHSGRRISLAVKIGLVFSSILLLATGFVGFLVFSQTRDRFEATSFERMNHAVALLESRFAASLSAIGDDIEFLAHSPAVKGITRAHQAGGRDDVTGLTSEQWIQQLAEICAALLKSRPSYFQARLIGTEDGGRELLRIEQDVYRQRRVPEEQLQRKGDRDYFRHTIALPPRTVYLSDIDLNREYGRISYPLTPTIRVATPVYDRAGGAFGIIVINVDLHYLLRELRVIAGPYADLHLVNHRGDYLAHPDSARTFGFDRGRIERLQDDYPQSMPLFLGESNELQLVRQADSDDRKVLHLRRFNPFNDSWRFLLLGLSTPYSRMVADADVIHRRSITLTVGIALLGLVLTLVFARYLTRPLSQITRAVQGFGEGEGRSLLPVERSDEFGALALAFRRLSDRITSQFGKLEHEIRERRQAEQKLRQAKQAAEEAARVKEDFLSLMSHEIRTPMNAVIGMARLLQRSEQSAGQQQIVRTLKFAADNLMALINDILDYSKIEAGGIVFEQTDFAPGELFVNIVESHRPRANDKNLRLGLTVDSSLPAALHGDPVRLYQVVNNLLDNALKFTEKGGIDIEVQSTRCAADRHRLCISVRDSGIGISPAQIEHIFERFRQAESSTTRRYGGSGLGLTISKKLVELQGGQIAVTSEIGRGSTFQVSLEYQEGLALSSPEEPGSGGSSAGHSLRGLRILYVEDVAYNVFLLESIVAEWGVELHTASTGSEGIAKAGERRYDLILLDIQLPDISGYEVAATLRAESEGPNAATVIVAVTAFAADEAQAAMRQADIAGYLSKPLEPQALYRCLQNAARHRASDNPSHIDTKEEPSFAVLEHNYDYEADKIRRALQLLHQVLDDGRRTIREAVEAGDAARLRAAQHRILPHIKTLGMKVLEGRLSAAAAMADNADTERLRREAACIDEALDDILAGIAAKLGSSSD